MYIGNLLLVSVVYVFLEEDATFLLRVFWVYYQSVQSYAQFWTRHVAHETCSISQLNK